MVVIPARSYMNLIRKKPLKSLTLARDIQVEDTAAALIQIENGALITIDSATTAYPGYETTFEIHGEKGSIVFNDDEIKTWAFIDEKDAPPLPEKGEAVGGGKSNVNIGSYGHYELFCDLISAIKEDRPCLIPPEDAKTAVQVICGIYESEKTGQVLSMN